jgi:signal transduction histidine kinase
MDLSTAKLGARRASGHLCFPYESEEEKRAALVTFIREGMERHERCLYIGSHADQVDLMAALEAAGVPAERALDRGALVLATQGETYLRSGRFDPDDALCLMEGLVDRALADGFTGLRGTGEASGPVPDELWPLVLRYEALLNERLGRRPFVALCRFHAAQVRPERVQDVLRTHPLVLVSGDVCTNPFYERPEVVLSDDSRARLDWQLHQLRSHNRARKRLEAREQLEQREQRDNDPRRRFLSVLADELAEPLFALEREVHALGETPAPERLEAAQRQLRRLSAVVDQVRSFAELGRPLPDDAGESPSTPRRSRA